MRAWQRDLQASGAFGSYELGAAIRTAVRAWDVDAAQREAYVRDLLGLALASGVPLDGRAASYLLWGPAKLGTMAADDADLQAALPLAMQHVDAMEVRVGGWLGWRGRAARGGAGGGRRLPQARQHAPPCCRHTTNTKHPPWCRAATLRRCCGRWARWACAPQTTGCRRCCAGWATSCRP